MRSQWPYERYASLPLVLTCLGEPSELRQQRCTICIAAQRLADAFH